MKPNEKPHNRKAITDDRKRSIGMRRISVATCAFILIVLLACYFFITNVQKNNRTVVLDELDSYAQTMQSLLSTHMFGDIAALRGVATCISDSAKQIDVDEITELLKEINKTNDFVRIGYAVRSGQVDMYDSEGNSYHSDLSNDEFFLSAQKGEYAVQNVMRDPFSDKWILRYAVPVIADDNVVGVIIGVHDAEEFRRVVKEGIWGDNGYACIVDSDGNMVMNSVVTDIGANECATIYDLCQFSGDEQQRMISSLNGEGGSYLFTDTNGNKMTAVVKPIGINNWNLICTLSNDLTDSTFTANAAMMMVALAISLIVFLALMYVSIRVINRSQKQLSEQYYENSIVIEQSGKHMLRYDIETSTLTNVGKSPKNIVIPEVIFGYPESMTDQSVVMPESREVFKNFFQRMRNGEPQGSVDVHCRLKDGTCRWYHADYTLIPAQNGKQRKSIILLFDNTEAWEKELAYELRQTELNALIADSVFYVEANLMTGHIETSHGEHINMEGFTGSEDNLIDLVEWDARSNVFSDDAIRFREFFDKKRLLSLYAMGVYMDSLQFRVLFKGEMTIQTVSVQMVKYPYNDNIKIYIVFKKSGRKEGEYSADTPKNDELTKLPNRESTMSEIEKYLLCDGASGTHAVVMIDIDSFKTVNSTLGHHVGDKALIEIAKTVNECFNAGDIVGRIGGDEFIVFMKNADKSGIIHKKARQVMTAIQRINTDDSTCLNLTCSIGITVYHGNIPPQKTVNQLYSEADAALYKAKANGKNCMAFADDLDAVEVVPMTVASHGALAQNLRNLLNNLGNGIEIYHGSADGELTPLFCNESLLNLIGGISEEEFKVKYGEDAFSGAHPDDRKGLITVYNDAHDNRTNFSHTYRIKGAGGKYYWVTVFGNFVWYEDGSYDMYAIYSDAEQLVRSRAALEERYMAFSNYRSISSSSVTASLHMNLTLDVCSDGVSKIEAMDELISVPSVTAFIEKLNEKVLSRRAQKKISESYTIASLISGCQRGEASLSLEFLCKISETRQLWLRMIVELAENPETHEIEAIVNFFNIDKETRLQFMVQRLLSTDYEFLAQIDTVTGIISLFGDNDSVEPQSIITDEVKYSEQMPTVLKPLILDEFYDDAVETLSIDNIIKELETSETFTCTFPTKECGELREGFRQWRCGYISERKNVIMMSRTDVTNTIAGELDSLTGLPNQFGFYNRVTEELKAHPNRKYRILRFDFDDFKLLNDTLGFACGDRLLRDFGAQLRRRAARLDEKVIFARLEADHFVSFRSESGTSAESLIGELNGWLESYPLDYTVTAHMGVYYIEDPEMDISAMCDRALLALKSVKDNFVDRVGYYDDSLRDRLIGEQELVRDMEKALSAGQFEVYFQPQFNYEDNSLIGAEALVRWNHPEKGLISPGAFIPLFERNGFITSLDEFMWDKSCEYINKWMSSPQRYIPITVSVNISRMDIYNRNLVKTLKAITKKHKVPTSMLKLEITESAYMRNPEQLIRVVSELQKEGFTIEMDDFGSGYSSLNTLKDVPVDILKLDMKFLEKCENDERSGNIISSVIRMAHWLKIPIIAEGVETKVQADYLKSLGCFYMQGYHFARPMPVEELEELLMSCRLGATDRYSGSDIDGVAAFWDASAQTALLFNSYVGGAAIIEYNNGNVEMLRANDKFYSQVETTREEYLQKQLHTLERFEGEHRLAFAGMLEEAILTGNETECDVQSLPQNEGGRAFWTHNRVKLLAKSGDSYLFYLAIENITERKETEEQLRLSRETLQLAILQTGRVICNYDIAAHELTMPEIYARKHGLEPTVRNTALLFDRIMSVDIEKFRKFCDGMHAGDRTGSVLVRIATTDTASYTWEKVEFVTVFTADDRPANVVITCEDVTAIKEQEADAVKSGLIVQQTGINIMDYDVFTDRMIFKSGATNVETEVIHDYLSSYLDSDACRIHPDDRQYHRSELMRIMSEAPHSGMYECRADNWRAGYKWSRLNYESIGDSAGKVYRIVGQICDIQKEKDDDAIVARINSEFAMETPGYKYNAAIAERVLTLLYATEATEATINTVLALMGEYFDLSRAYIFEDSVDHKYCRNTFEWNGRGVESVQEKLQRVSYADDLIEQYHTLFDNDGMFIYEDLSALPKQVQDVLAQYNVKSILQSSLMDDGVFAGYIGFYDCRGTREWTQEQIGTLRIVARLVGAFLMKKRKKENAEFSDDFLAALDNNASYIYIVDPSTYEVVYNNKAMQSKFGVSYEGKTCYREFISRDEPCEQCPMFRTNEDGVAQTAKILRPDGMLLLTHTVPMRWNGKSLMMITCVDITEYADSVNE